MLTRLLAGALALVGVLFMTPSAVAQTVGVPLQVRTGEVYTLQIEGRGTSRIEGSDVEGVFDYVFAVHILDADQRLWRYTPVSMSFAFPSGLGPETESLANLNWTALSEAMSAMTRIGTDVGFECRVDEYGRCQEMTNWPFWSARLENLVLMIDGFAGMVPAPPPGKPGQAQAGPDWRALRPVVLQGIARLIDGIDARDAGASMWGLYYPAFVQGRTLTRRQDVDFVDEIDMPFGASPVRLTGTLRLDRIDRRTNTAIVIRRASIGRESVQAAAGGVVRYVSDALVQPLATRLGEGQQAPNADVLAAMVSGFLDGFTYEETTTGVIDLATGMARETTTDYVMRMAPPAGGDGEPLMAASGRMVTRMTLGAPDQPRLPRS